jgi:predicted ribosome quality control (RQC) complex YloA/Tae2 family protein
MDSISSVIFDYYNKKDKVNRMLHKTQNLRKFLSQRIDRLNNKLQKLKEEQLYAENAEDSKILGELILANLYQIEKGMHKVKVLNYYEEGSPETTVNLDSRLTPSENAQRYFKKYNKLKTAQTELAVQIEEAQGDLAYLEQVMTAVEQSSDPANIEEIRQELVETGIMKRKHQQKQRNKSKFTPLRYVSSEGYEILVGKNNLQNDYLTLKYASNKDMWLHTKIIPGSHVIVRTQGDDLSEQTIYEAACIAAWHSKGRLSGQVPVDYTLVKNVSKPGGAKPGMVIYLTNQTVYVTPDEEDIASMRADS